MLEIVDYEPKHAIDLLDSPRQQGLEDRKITEQLAEEKARHPAFTGIWNGRIVGCGGIHIIRPGFGEAWALYADDVASLHIDPQLAKAKFHEMIRDNNILICQAPLRADWQVGIKYAEFMGFVFEERKEKYFPDGCDALMYVIMNKGD